MMHRIFFIVGMMLLMSRPLVAEELSDTRIVYTAHSENIANPERGFYHQDTPLWLGTEHYPQDAANLRAMRDEGISLLRWYFLIDEYRDAPLDAEVLTFIAGQFAAAREAGMKVIPRFAYNFPQGGEYPFQDPDATLERVLAHIDQLKPLLQQNSDVIAFMEAGFVGAWGEWHSSTNGLIDEGSINSSTEMIVTHLLDALPIDRMIAVRYPNYKQQFYGQAPLTESQAFTGIPQARMGAHNDCFLASYTDWGTYSEDAAERDAQRAYLEADNHFVPQGGETCNAAEDAEAYIGCENALSDLALLHFSALNIDYHPDVLDGWRAEGCFDEIAQRLGYRFRLIEATIPEAADQGGTFNIHITVVNDGFASPYNRHGIEIILRSVTDGTVFRLLPTTPIDVRFWQPSAGEIDVMIETKLPDDLPAGEYEVLLNLPDPAPTLYERPEYAIQLANEGLWENNTGFNDLGATVSLMD
jgi:hypothetical protein